MTPRNGKGTAGPVPPDLANHSRNTANRIRPRRNAHKRHASELSVTLARLGDSGGAPRGRTATPRCDGDAPSLLLANGSTARDAWVEWLSPVFASNDSCYFTGTYSDDYGYANGLTLVRNVHKDFKRWLESFGFEHRYINGVEAHRYRDVLHLHAVLEGPFNQAQLDWLKAWWQVERGFARALPVLDGCTSYVTKYALKGDSDSFEWSL